MKRDYELLRNILEFAEEHGQDRSVKEVPGDLGDAAAVSHHVGLCVDIGLVNAANMTGFGSEHRDHRIGSLTWIGHVVLSGLREGRQLDDISRDIGPFCLAAAVQKGLKGVEEKMEQIERELAVRSGM